MPWVWLPPPPPLFSFCLSTLVPGNSLPIFIRPQPAHCCLSTPPHTVLGASLLLPHLYLDMSTSKLLRPRAQLIALETQKASASAPNPSPSQLLLGKQTDRSTLSSEIQSIRGTVLGSMCVVPDKEVSGRSSSKSYSGKSCGNSPCLECRGRHGLLWGGGSLCRLQARIHMETRGRNVCCREQHGRPVLGQGV